MIIFRTARKLDEFFKIWTVWHLTNFVVGLTTLLITIVDRSCDVLKCLGSRKAQWQLERWRWAEMILITQMQCSTHSCISYLVMICCLLVENTIKAEKVKHPHPTFSINFWHIVRGKLQKLSKVWRPRKFWIVFEKLKRQNSSDAHAFVVRCFEGCWMKF